MTLVVEPTNGPGRKVYPTRLASAVRYGTGDWIVPSTEVRQATRDPVLADGPLNAFASSHSSSSLTVTIDTGEAFIGGAYVASDDSTNSEHDVTLNASTADQTVYLGYDETGTDALIIGTASAFPSANNPRIPIWKYTTDATGVTMATSQRPLVGQTDLLNKRYDDDLDGVVDTAEDANSFSGFSPNTWARDIQTASIPLKDIPYNETHAVVEVIPAGKTLKLLRASAYDYNGEAHNLIYARVMTAKFNNVVYSETPCLRKEGTIANPLVEYTADGGEPQAVEFQVYQRYDNGSEIVGAKFNYIIE